MRHALLQGIDRFGLAFGRGRDERPDFVGEEIGVAAAHRRLRLRRLLLAEQLAEETAAALLLQVRRRRRELRNGVRLDVLRASQRAQVGHELFLVARREERRQQDDVGNPGGQRRNSGITRVDDHEVGVDLLANDAFEDSCLAVVRLDREHERQCQCPVPVDRGLSAGARRPDGKARRARIFGIFE